MSYIHRGLIPDGGGLYFLPRRVGLPRAKELIFTGRRVAPDEALRIGMIDRIAAPETLLAQARAWAAELVFAMGSAAQAICYTTPEHRQSVTAFLDRADKRPG